MRSSFILVISILPLIFCKFQDHRVVQTVQKNITDSLNISVECRDVLQLYRENLEEEYGRDNWALQMLDATSKLPVGLLSYNFGEMGNFEQCIKARSRDELIFGKYCLGQISITNTSIESGLIQQQLIWKHILDGIAPGMRTSGNNPTWAICLPANCSNEDILTILSLSESIGLSFDSITCQTHEDANPSLDVPALFAITILLAIVLLMALSTSYDVFCAKNHKKPVHPILIIFSVRSNGRKLFAITNTPSALSSLHGIRVLSMGWIIMAHTTSIYPNGPTFNAKDFIGVSQNPGSMLLASATMACDTFLLVGGALVVYVFFQHQGSSDKFKLNILAYYFHRYLRITPAMAGMVLVSATLLQYMGSGPNWSYITVAFQGFCKDYWWSSLLYIQNYVNVSTMCVGHSWYLNIDWQLYLISPVFLYLLLKYPKIGICAISLLCLASMATSFYVSYSNNLLAIMISQNQTRTSDSFSNDYYLRTHTRASPWLIGLILGYLLAKFKNPLRLTKKVICTIWIIFLLTLSLCVFGGYGTLTGANYDRIGNALHIALVRPAWAVALSWTIWACTVGHGGVINGILSLPIFQVFSKFTYSMYLLHVTMLYLIVYGAKISIYMTPFTLFFNFLGMITLTFLVSIFWVLAFESPALALEKVMLTRNRGDKN